MAAYSLLKRVVMFILTFCLLYMAVETDSPLFAQSNHNIGQDWRLIDNGSIIPTPGAEYADQPYIVQTDDGAWLCTVTIGHGKEGQSGQHIVTSRSTDYGKTWSDPVAVEPADGPVASYSVLLKTPNGRVYCFYNHNTDNIDKVIADKDAYPDGFCRRVDSLGYYVFKYSDDHGKSWSQDRYVVDIREMEIDRQNPYQGNIRFFWNVGKPFIFENSAYISVHKVGGFGRGFFTRSEGVLLRSDNLLTEENPARIKWETLPQGDYGLRTPEGGGPIAEEQSYSVMSDGSFFVIYRTVDGHPVCAYSRDRGNTWSEPAYMTYTYGGKKSSIQELQTLRGDAITESICTGFTTTEAKAMKTETPSGSVVVRKFKRLMVW